MEYVFGGALLLNAARKAEILLENDSIIDRGFHKNSSQFSEQSFWTVSFFSSEQNTSRFCNVQHSEKPDY